MRILTFTVCLIANLAAAEICDPDEFSTRLGFSPWPPDLSLDGLDRAYDFIAENGNIILHHFDNGVPWVEALANQPFPDHLMREWTSRRERTPPDMPILLALTPLDMTRSNLALAWTKSGEGQPLPDEWQDKPFNDPDVIDAFVAYTLAAIAYFDPAFLAIGIESNILISKAPQKWVEYLQLNATVYNAVKQVHPNLPVFSTIQYEHLRGIEEGSKHYAFLQQSGVAALMEYSDILALSTYRYGYFHPNPPSDNYFDLALSYGKPVAIAESGAQSDSILMGMVPLPSNTQTQSEFVTMLLQSANDHDFPFLINWVTVDYEGTLASLPTAFRDLAKAWVFTGLEAYDGTPKPVLATWRECLGK